MRRIALAAVAAATLGLLAAAPTVPAFQIFMQASGIPGESTDKDFQGAAEIRNYGWGVGRSAATRTRPAAAAFSEINVTKGVDSMSPTLMLRVADGKAIPSVKLTMRTEAENPEVVHELCLRNVTVAGLSQSLSTLDRTESLSLNYGTIVQRVTPAPKEFGVAGWDVVKSIQLNEFGDTCGK